MANDKRAFFKSVTVLVDSREQKNGHILSALDAMKVPYETRKLDFGDYSFCVGERDFSLSCVIERKANINELYGNVNTADHRARLENELFAARCMGADVTLLLENCADEASLKEYQVPEWEMQAYNRKIKETGIHCYQTISSWQRCNRYSFQVAYVKDPQKTAVRMLECFYYYWRNYKALIAGRRT